MYLNFESPGYCMSINFLSFEYPIEAKEGALSRDLAAYVL